MTARNRVWDPTASAHVTWRTGSPDPTGIEYPGPDAFANTSDYCALASDRLQPPVEPEQLTDEDSPAGLWLFDGDLLDSSGNGRNLGLVNGIVQFGPGPKPGTRALFLNGGTKLDVADAAFAALGDVTIEAMVYPQILESASQAFIATYALDGATDPNDNAHYSLRLVTNNRVSIFHERLSGVNQTVDGDVLPPFKWSHMACVRDGVNNSIYVNGVQVLTTGALLAPTGGSANRFTVGDFPANTGAFHGFIASLRVWPGVVRTDAQLLAAARNALPPGVRP